jgi:PAS domain S-box-containing protein
MKRAELLGWSRQARYGAAFIAVALAVAVRFAVDPLLGDRSPFILFVVGVIGAGLYGGVGPAVLALVLSLLAGTLLFVAPRGTLYTDHPDTLANIAAFALTGGALIWMLRGKALAERNTSEVRTTSERALNQSRELLEAVIESAPDPIYVKDVEGRLTILNSATAAVFGERREDVVGRYDRDFMPPHAAARIEQVDAEVLAGATRVVEELVLDSAKGAWRDYLSTKSPMLDASGAVVGLVGLSRDITERKLAEKELVRLNRELEVRVGERTAQLEQANTSCSRSPTAWPTTCARRCAP